MAIQIIPFNTVVSAASLAKRTARRELFLYVPITILQSRAEVLPKVTHIVNLWAGLESSSVHLQPRLLTPAMPLPWVAAV